MQTDLATFEASANTVADLLRTLGNQRRLMILCTLLERDEATAGELADVVALSQSALSQHLTRLRAEGIVAFRRESQTLWYRLADPRIAQLMAELYRLYCQPAADRSS